MSQRRDIRFDLFDVTEIDTAFRQFADDDLAQTPQATGVFGRERDLLLLVNYFRSAAFKIEPRGQFFAGLIERVVNFLLVYFRDDVERRHISIKSNKI